MESLKNLINRAGGLTKVSNAMTEKGVKTSPQCVAGWVRRGRIPADVLWVFCEATGFAPSEIRPDLFPTPEEYWVRTRRITDKRIHYGEQYGQISKN